MTAILCAALLAACGDATSTTSRTATVPTGTLGDVGTDGPLSPSAFAKLSRYNALLQADLKKRYDAIERCQTRLTPESRWKCRVSLGHSGQVMSLSASDEFLKAADQGQGTSACGKDLHAHGLVLGEAARGFGAMNAGAEFALRTTRTEHYDEAIAALPALYAPVAQYTLSPRCDPDAA